jgi:hypothetical protein
MMKYLFFLFLIIPSIGLCQNVIFFYDFNGDQIGKVPAGGWKATAAGEVEIIDFPNANNKSVKITDTGSGGGMTLLLDKPIKDKIVSLEFKFLRDKKWAVACEIFYIMNQKCPDDWSGICIKDNDNGKISYHDGVGWIDAVDLKDDVWHDVKLVFYLENDKYDFYYDGKLMGDNAGYRNWGGLSKQGIDKFNVANVGDGGSTFIKYFDDIILYEGSIRNVAVAPRDKLSTVWGNVKISVSDDPYMKYPGGHKGTRFERGLLSQSKFVP